MSLLGCFVLVVVAVAGVRVVVASERARVGDPTTTDGDDDVDSKTIDC